MGENCCDNNAANLKSVQDNLSANLKSVQDNLQNNITSVQDNLQNNINQVDEKFNTPTLYSFGDSVLDVGTFGHKYEIGGTQRTGLGSSGLNSAEILSHQLTGKLIYNKYNINPTTLTLQKESTEQTATSYAIGGSIMGPSAAVNGGVLPIMSIPNQVDAGLSSIKENDICYVDGGANDILGNYFTTFVAGIVAAVTLGDFSFTAMDAMFKLYGLTLPTLPTGYDLTMKRFLVETTDIFLVNLSTIIQNVTTSLKSKASTVIYLDIASYIAVGLVPVYRMSKYLIVASSAAGGGTAIAFTNSLFTDFEELLVLFSGSLKTLMDGMDIKYVSADDIFKTVKVQYPTYNYEVPSGTFFWSGNVVELPTILNVEFSDPGQVVKNIADMSGSTGDPKTSYPVYINNIADSVNLVLPGTLSKIDLTNATGATETDLRNFEWNQFNSLICDRIHPSYFSQEQMGNYILNEFYTK